MLEKEVNFFSDVDGSKYFYVVNGDILKNISDLIEFLNSSDYDTFSYHVNAHKNDFAIWIENVFNDHLLAEEIRSVISQKELHDIICAKSVNYNKFLEVEQNLLKKTKELMTILKIKEKHLDDKKKSGIITLKMNEYLEKVDFLRTRLENVYGKLRESNNLSEEDVSKEFLTISNELTSIAKLISHISLLESTNSKKNDVSETAIKLLDGTDYLNNLIKKLTQIEIDNKTILLKNESILDDKIKNLNNNFNSWKIASVSDMQELKSYLLGFESFVSQKLSELDKVPISYDSNIDKLKRHTTLINHLDKDVFELKDNIKEHENKLDKVFTLLKEISLSLKKKVV